MDRKNTTTTTTNKTKLIDIQNRLVVARDR